MCLNCLNRHMDSSTMNSLCAYELARQARIARNNRELAKLKVCERAADFAASLADPPKPKKARVVKVKGRLPDRKSDRHVKAIHSSLSEELLLGGPEAKSFSYTASRLRFEGETMPKRKAAAHEFDERLSFSSPETQATAGQWYAILAQQADAKKFPPTCEQMAFNLGEQWVALDSIMGAGESTIKAVKDVAYTDMTPKLGPEMVFDRVLEKLQQGATNADDFNDRRWGPGKSYANNNFRAFLESMVNDYGEAATLSGIEVFVSKPKREAEVAKILDDTWAVISDMPDAIKLYGKNPVAGKGYNSDFRKVLSRKFNEARKKHGKAAPAQSTVNMAQQAGSSENVDPNASDIEEATAS